MPSDLSTTGLAALNNYIKSLRNRGVLLSSLTTDSFAIVADTASYTLSPRVLSVSAVRYEPTGESQRPLYEETRVGYLEIPDKTNSGDPSLYYLDQQRGSSVMYIWPVPDTASGTIYYSHERIVEDLDAITNDFDLDPEHLETIVWNLAARLAPEFTDLSHPNPQFIISKAEQMEMDMLSASRPDMYEICLDPES